MAALIINGAKWKSGDLKLSPAGVHERARCTFRFTHTHTHTGEEVNGVASAESRCDMTAASWEHGGHTGAGH